MIRALAIDDEGPALRRLSKMIESHHQLVLVGAADSGKEAIELIRSVTSELIFLDINLKDMSAFEVLEQVSLVFSGRVVFVTAYDEFALKAFVVGAIDYLLKPFDHDRFHRAVFRAMEREKSANVTELLQLYSSMGQERIVIREGKHEHYFSPMDIRFIRADGYHSVIHFSESKKLLRLTLKEMLRQLPKGFKRVNRSVIVNVAMIVERTQSAGGDKLKLSCGTEFRRSRSY